MVHSDNSSGQERLDSQATLLHRPNDNSNSRGSSSKADGRLSPQRNAYLSIRWVHDVRFSNPARRAPQSSFLKIPRQYREWVPPRCAEPNSSDSNRLQDQRKSFELMLLRYGVHTNIACSTSAVFLRPLPRIHRSHYY